MSNPLKRKDSMSSNKSIRSIDEFRFNSPFDQYVRTKKFPYRPAINIMIILLSTVQVFLLLNSRIYLRGELVRSFLSIYVNGDTYPQMFAGHEFYLELTGIQQVKQHFEFMFNRINHITQDSFIDYYYEDAKIILHTAYKQFAGREHRKNVDLIDPKQGIIHPFNMSNITDIQIYLLQTEQFQIQIQNLTLRENWEGFSQKYSHLITYTFVDSIKLRINFDFSISNAMVKQEDQHNHTNSLKNKPKNANNLRMGQCLSGCYIKTEPLKLSQSQFRTSYIVRVRIFYGFVLIVSIISLYLNYNSIRKTYKILYKQLSKNPITSNNDNFEQTTTLQQLQLQSDVQKWVTANKLTISQIKMSHYFHILEFDLIFSTLSNIFEIITAFYLVSGIERQRMAGIVCLFSWMTIFKLVRNYKKLVLMYQLIKISIVSVTSFFIEFLPVFISYALLGTCLFPKVSFFSSFADSSTTLVSLMMGDSIQMITAAIQEKNSTILSMFYIFSFVLLFMHAIHNTLTSLIKQFFIIKKIELINHQKQINHEQKYLYLQQNKVNSEIQKNKLPLKVTDSMMRGILRAQTINKTKKYEYLWATLMKQLQTVKLMQKWTIWQKQLSSSPIVKKQLIRRSIALSVIIDQFYNPNKSSLLTSSQSIKQ